MPATTSRRPLRARSEALAAPEAAPEAPPRPAVLQRVPPTGIAGAPAAGLQPGEYRVVKGSCFGFVEYPCGGIAWVGAGDERSVQDNARDELRRDCPCTRGGACRGRAALGAGA